MLLAPISIGLGLCASIVKEAVRSEAGKSVVSGIIGNRADHYFMKGMEQIKGILDIRNHKYPENHDLLRVIRKSMLEATDMIRQAMKEADEDKEFRGRLNKWISTQLGSISDISSWPNWQTPAAGQLETFFRPDERKEQLEVAMTAAWSNYLAAQLDTSLPTSFLNRLNQGWSKDGRLLTWSEVTIVLTIEALRDPKNDTGMRAAKAFEQTFLAELKLQLLLIHKQLLAQIPNAELISSLTKTVSSQQDTIGSQQQTIADLAATQGIQIKGNLSIVRRELTTLAFQYDDRMEKAQGLMTIDRGTAKVAFMESARVLNHMITLYESSKFNFSPEAQRELGELLLTVRQQEDLTALIIFVQRFDQILNLELSS